MVWSVTTDFLYLRFIGDRSIQEKDFGRIQIDRALEMQKWAGNFKTVEDERVQLAIVPLCGVWAWNCESISEYVGIAGGQMARQGRGTRARATISSP
jgi:hypothetical protein